MSLKGKNIIITGCTSGISVPWAAALSNEGANVFIGGRREEKGLEVAKHSNSTFHKVDVASEESNKEFFAAATGHFGGSESEPTCVDFIFLNAGVSGTGDNTVESYDFVFGVNVRGVILGLQYGTSLLRNGGKIVITSSVHAILELVHNSIYSASKAAVDSLTRSHAKQFADSEDKRLQSLSIYSINPCWYRSEMTEASEDKEGMAKMFNPSQHLGTGEELSKTIQKMVEGKLPYESGANICVDADTHFPLNEYISRLKAAQEQ